MMPRVNVALTVARLAYVVVGLAAPVIGWEAWEKGESPASLVVLGGGLALAAAAWVTSDGLVRGAIASVGIVVGASMVAMTSFLAAFVIGWLVGLLVPTPPIDAETAIFATSAVCCCSRLSGSAVDNQIPHFLLIAVNGAWCSASSQRGIPHQCNMGARLCRGDWLLFVSADSRQMDLYALF